MSSQYYLVLLITLFFCLSCKDTNSSESSKIEKDSADSIANLRESEQATAKEVKIYCWVNKLRVREAPDTKSKIVVELNEGDSLIYLKEQSDFTQKINLRGKVFDEPWLKVRTSNKQIGWIYGGGVKFYAPKASRVPTLYDECFEYLKEYRETKFQSCFEKIQAVQYKRTEGIVTATTAVLSLRLLTGEKKILENDNSEDRYLQHRFYYYYPKMSSFVVEVIYEDGANFILVNDKSGKVTEIWGYPKPSPDNKQWVVSSADSDGGLRANGMQILSYTDNGLEVTWQEEMKEEPFVPFWLDEETIEVSTKKRNSSKTSIKTLIKNGAGEWEWNRR